MSAANQHACPITGCTVKVPRSRLMCKAHWARVPADLQRALYRAYRALNACTDHVDDERGHDPFADHAQAMEDCIAAVEGREPTELTKGT